jgi:hypothetical protein
MASGPSNQGEIDMNKRLRAALAVTLAFAPATFAATSYTSFSAGDDPARWYQPLETSKQKYDNAMLEARNALAEALRECRATRAGAACESAARRQYREEVAQARVFLEPARQIG